MKDYELRDIPTFFDAPFGDLVNLSENTIAVAGVFCDHYGGGKPGSRITPRQLRYSSYPEEKHTGMDCIEKNVIDIGDLNVFPLEYQKNYDILKSQSKKIVNTKSKQLIIGGDYSIIPAIFDGVLESLGTKNIGFIRISRRLDIVKGDFKNQPSVSRFETSSKIIDLLDGDKSKINIIGVSGVITNEEIIACESINYLQAKKLKDINNQDFISNINKWSEDFDGLYISVDADVLKPMILETTLENMYCGLNLKELLDLLELLKKVEKPFVAGDFTGFVPEIDLWGRDEIETAQTICAEIVNVLRKEECYE